jgi:hypothetical protein
MRVLDAEQVEIVLAKICRRVDDEYDHSHTVHPGVLTGEPCPLIVFYGKKAVYAAYFGNKRTVVRLCSDGASDRHIANIEGDKEVAFFEDITKDSLLR